MGVREGTEELSNKAETNMIISELSFASSGTHRPEVSETGSLSQLVWLVSLASLFLEIGSPISVFQAGITAGPSCPPHTYMGSGDPRIWVSHG